MRHQYSSYRWLTVQLKCLTDIKASKNFAYLLFQSHTGLELRTWRNGCGPMVLPWFIQGGRMATHRTFLVIVVGMSVFLDMRGTLGQTTSVPLMLIVSVRRGRYLLFCF